MKPCLLLAACLLMPLPALAEEGSGFSLIVDNDSFIPNTDRHYTNGLYASWTGAPEQRDDDIANFARHLMLDGDKNAAWRTTYMAGQNIYTPQNLRAAIPSAEDRPYAGWLYAGARLTRDSGDTLDSLEAQVGIIGPSSLAGDLQTAWHKTRLFGGAYPNGWHYQLHGEPGLVLGEQRIWRVGLTDGLLESELLPQAGFKLGNVYTYGSIGGMLRVGSGLKADWGPPRIAPGLNGADFQSSDAAGWYLFGGFETRAIARNLFLDGSSFEDSPRVGHKVINTDLTAGAAIMFPGVRLMASYTNRGREFRTQVGNDQLVSVSLTVMN